MNLVCRYSPGWSVQRARCFLRALPHPLLRRFAADLIELNFGPGPDQTPRWATAAFLNGARLARTEPDFARELLANPPRALSLTPDVLWANLTDSDSPSSLDLDRLRAAFRRCIESQAGRPDPEDDSGAAESHLAAWITTAAWWGLEAGLAQDHLNLGLLLALTDTHGLAQRFIGDRLLCLGRSRGQPRQPALVSLVEYSYPATPVERVVITGAAREFWRAQSRSNNRLNAGDWILGGFRAGLFLAWREPAICRRLFDESPEGTRISRELFAEYIGADVCGWLPDRLVARSLDWLARVHPRVAGQVGRPEELERLRHLFDFAFWMGLVTRD